MPQPTRPQRPQALPKSKTNSEKLARRQAAQQLYYQPRPGSFAGVVFEVVDGLGGREPKGDGVSAAAVTYHLEGVSFPSAWPEGWSHARAVLRAITSLKREGVLERCKVVTVEDRRQGTGLFRVRAAVRYTKPAQVSS